MSKPSIRTITVKSMINLLLFAAVVLLAIVAVSFRLISHNVIQSKTLAVSQVISAGLTAHMKAEIMHKQRYFLEEIKSLHGVDDVSILSSAAVSDQYGPSNGHRGKADAVALEVFRSGKAVYVMNEFDITPHVRAVIPYIATKDGALNCLKCHNVPDGTVLGAVDIRLNLSEYRDLALGLMVGTAILGGLFVLLIIINTFGIIQKHVKRPLDELMNKAKDAYFTQTPLEPEVFASMEFEDIAHKFNMFNTAVLTNQTLIKEKNQELLAMNDEVEETLKQTIFTMGVVEEQRSRETSNHTKRVTEYCKLLASRLGLPDRDVELITAASPLHDIGKLGVPDSILTKPGKLTDDEFEIIKNHPGIGYAMLLHSSRDILKAAAIIAYQHHEKWDGTGYPRGLRGTDIHIFGRIAALADVYDALSSDRIYRRTWPDADVVSWISQQKGRHFDPDLVDIFMDNLADFSAIRNAYRQNGTQSPANPAG